MHCNVREPCSACRLPFQIENQIGIRDCFDICHSSMQKVLSRLACISVSFFIFVIKSTGCPKKKLYPFLWLLWRNHRFNYLGCYTVAYVRLQVGVGDLV